MPRDYNFWIYIVTNRNQSVLYIGVTNRLSRRTWEHREGDELNSSKYQCKNSFITSIMATFAMRRPRIAAKEVVESQKNRANSSIEPSPNYCLCVTDNKFVISRAPLEMTEWETGLETSVASAGTYRRMQRS